MLARFLAALSFAALAAGACVPPASPPPPGAAGEGRPATRDPPRTLSILVRAEVPFVGEGASSYAIHKPLLTAPLGIWDHLGAPSPLLAQALPQLNTDSWRVFPDGRMQTVYRLRPGLTWHDTRPLTAEDFVFTLGFDLARIEWGLHQISGEVRQIDEILAPDAHTVVIRWRQPYPEAAAPELLAVPRHILEGPLAQGTPDAVGSHPFWTAEYVGAGPYRVERWEPGSLIEGAAFDGYALGRPRIERIRLSWSNDPNVSLTRLLAGEADVAVDNSILFQQARILKERWSPESGGTVLLNPTTLRWVQSQHKPSYANPQSLLDARVRKAILHAIDRSALAETILEDRSMVADTVPPPTVPYYQALDRAIAKYPYDLRRFEQLMAEAGFSRETDRFYSSASEGRFRLEVRGVVGGPEEQDTTIIADYLRQAGVDASIALITSAQRARDDLLKATFSGLNLNNNTLSRGLGLNKWITSQIAAPENNWIGQNQMGWSNPEFDRLHELWTISFEPRERAQHLIGMMKLLSEELPSFTLYYNFQVIAHSRALVGPEPLTPDATRYGNVHQWAWR